MWDNGQYHSSVSISVSQVQNTFSSRICVVGKAVTLREETTLGIRLARTRDVV